MGSGALKPNSRLAAPAIRHRHPRAPSPPKPHSPPPGLSRPHSTSLTLALARFLQADTGLERPNAAIPGEPIRVVGVPIFNGREGECGSQCTTDPGCKSWTYFAQNQSCRLMATAGWNASAVAHPGAISGATGDLARFSSWNWTALPEMFRTNVKTRPSTAAPMGSRGGCGRALASKLELSEVSVSCGFGSTNKQLTDGLSCHRWFLDG